MSGYTLMSGVMTITQSVYCPVCCKRQDASQKRSSDVVRNRHGSHVHDPKSAHFLSADLCCSKPCLKEWKARLSTLCHEAHKAGHLPNMHIREVQQRGVLRLGLRRYIETTL